MVSRLPVIDDDGEVEDLSKVDPLLFKPFAALPASLQAKLKDRSKAATKQRVTLSLSADVVSAFRATGAGWQGRVDAALRDWLKTHPPA